MPQIPPDEQVYDLLKTLVDGWQAIIVRVKQGGKMKFMSLGQVEDQALVYKITRDLLKQMALDKDIIKPRQKPPYVPATPPWDAQE